jgi:phosphatidylglycerophosphate synthase
LTPDTDSTTDRTELRAGSDPHNALAAPANPERARIGNYPISQWYVFPITRRIAAGLAPTGIRPIHITLLGLLFGLSAVALLLAVPTAGPVAGVLVLAAWFLDRTDGLLARRQQTASPFGAWLDANVDELHDVAWHTAAAYAAATLSGTQLPWFLLIGFLAGKYLFVSGLTEERALEGSSDDVPSDHERSGIGGWARAVYHLPGNADIRLHLLFAALLLGWMTAELAIIAAYYNLRWISRFGLVAHRLGGQA